MSAIRGLFKNDEDPAATAVTATGAATSGGGGADADKTVSGFLAGTSNFFSSVQAKKEGFMSDLSSKLNTLTPSFGGSGESATGAGTGKKQHGDSDNDDGGDSSASEYGDGGDKPVYAGGGVKAAEARRLSLDSVDSLPEMEVTSCRQFLAQIVDDILDSGIRIPEAKKSQLAAYSKHHTGRSHFSKVINKKRGNTKQVDKAVMRKLVDTFAILLPQCNDSEDFRPARLLMTLCFTFYTEEVTGEGQPIITHLYTFLREQPIWQSIRFWNASFFEALGHERAKKPEPTTDDVEKALNQDKEFQENVAYGQLSTFTWNMVALGLTREVVLEFLRKQAAVANLPRDKGRLIRANIQKWTS